MANAAAYIGAGLLGALGGALIEDGKTKRELMLKELDIRARRKENEEDRALRRGLSKDEIAARAAEGGETRKAAAARLQSEIDARAAEGKLTRAATGGLLKTVEQDTEGQYVGITAGGKPVPTGVKGRLKKPAGEDEWSASDKRLWETVIKRYSTKDPMLGNEKTDWPAAAAEFEARGRNDMARLAKPVEKQPEPPPGARQMTGTSLDSDTLPRSPKPSAGSDAAAGAVPPAQGKRPDTPPPPAGDGKSRESPVVITSQEQINSLPSGTWVSVDGKIGRKK